MYSPVPIENAPATSAAAPVRITVCAGTPPPPSPAISEALVTSPSTAPNTVGRSQPPDTSRCRCDQPAASAAAPMASCECTWSLLDTSGIILRCLAAPRIVPLARGARDRLYPPRPASAPLASSGFQAGEILLPEPGLGPGPPAAVPAGRRVP